ncbi:GTPase Der [bioreactor metagenome]|uniref:GTPase Der n=1 Tax=bioreactor metagenome TaxID=1076179 RepID=A0A645J749_9ZZZZ
MNAFQKSLGADLAFMSYVPMLFISAKSGQRVNKVLELVDNVFEQARRRIPTGQLNDVVSEAVMMNDPPSDKGKILKIYYATQVSVQPPTFVIFVNDTEIVHFSYERYLENYFRKSFGFEGTPIRLLFRSKKKENEQ